MKRTIEDLEQKIKDERSKKVQVIPKKNDIEVSKFKEDVKKEFEEFLASCEPSKLDALSNGSKVEWYSTTLEEHPNCYDLPIQQAYFEVLADMLNIYPRTLRLDISFMLTEDIITWVQATSDVLRWPGLAQIIYHTSVQVYLVVPLE